MKRTVWLVILAALASCRREDGRTQLETEPPPAAIVPDVTSEPVGEPIIATLTDAPNVPPPTFRKKPAKVIVNLEVSEVVKEIAPGVKYTMWTFGGSVPGKFIRVRQGDVVEMHLQNHPSSKLPHNIDLHAVTGPGGGAEPTFTAPGHESVFTFKAMNPGLYVYHCATAPVPVHVANGMYGLIFVEPPQGLSHAREYYVMQGELYTKGKYHEKGLQEFDMDKGIDEKPTYVLFNGAEGSLTGANMLKAKAGEPVRLYLGNGGPNLLSSFHVIGEIFDVVHTEGGMKTQEQVQTTVIPAGGSAIVEFTVNVPGKYILVDHSLFRAFNKGAIGMLEVTGPPRPDIYSGKQADKPYTGGAPAAVIAPTPATDVGQATYARVCAACHQPEGQGLPNAIPPLAKSDFLAAQSPQQLVQHMLNGLQGPITVNGQSFNGVMPPMPFLTDDEIAGALTHVNKSWGNKGPAISPADVAKIRAAGGTK